MGSLPDPLEERRVPQGIHLVVHQEEELHLQRQRCSRHGNLPKRGQGSRPSQEDVKEAAEDGEGTLQHGRPVCQQRRRNGRMTSRHSLPGLEFGSPWVRSYNEKQSEDSRLEDLNRLEEVRDITTIQSAKYL